MSDDDKVKRAAEISAAVRKHDDDKAHEGQVLNKMLSALGDISGHLRDLHKRHDDLSARVDTIADAHLPGAGAHHRGATVLDRGEPGHGKDLPHHYHDDGAGTRLPGEPRPVVADSADDPNEARYGHGNRKHDGAFLLCQVEADRVATAWGARSTPPMQSEKLLDFRRRCLRPWMRYSTQFKGIDPDELNEPMLTPVEKSVYADAWTAACSNASAPPDQLREVVNIDATGRRISTFYGEPKTWMQQFSGNRRRLVSIRTNFDR
jgi:hypothetical protein